MSSFLETISIDNNHIQLIYSLILCHKPKSILEIGIGSGNTTYKIIEAIKYNQNNTKLDCVDNFFDWKGNMPEHIQNIYNMYADTINLIQLDEQTFINHCNTKYDFIISDADHEHTNLWVDKTVNLLNPNGILIYHDITNPTYNNLLDIVRYTKKYNYNTLLFNQSSRPDERCYRGILVIQNKNYE